MQVYNATVEAVLPDCYIEPLSGDPIPAHMCMIAELPTIARMLEYATNTPHQVDTDYNMSEATGADSDTECVHPAKPAPVIPLAFTRRKLVNFLVALYSGGLDAFNAYSAGLVAHYLECNWLYKYAIRKLPFYKRYKLTLNTQPLKCPEIISELKTGYIFDIAEYKYDKDFPVVCTHILRDLIASWKHGYKSGAILLSTLYDAGFVVKIVGQGVPAEPKNSHTASDEGPAH